MELEGTSGGLLDLPDYLRRALTIEEINWKQNRAVEEGNKYVVWKFGRTTHHTFGIAAEIPSLYHWPDNKTVSDEWFIKDYKKSSFSKNGDSGSFIWDRGGYVGGLLWGGRDELLGTYATPMEIVLQSIKEVCGAREVVLVVRDEEKDTVTFAPESEPKDYTKLAWATASVSPR